MMFQMSVSIGQVKPTPNGGANSPIGKVYQEENRIG